MKSILLSIVLSCFICELFHKNGISIWLIMNMYEIKKKKKKKGKKVKKRKG